MSDFYGTLNFKKNKMSLGSTLHAFAAANKVRAIDGSEMNAWLGLEADVFAAWELSEQVRLSIGYSQMFGSETLERVSGGSKDVNNYWAFAMMTFKPKFLNK